MSEIHSADYTIAQLRNWLRNLNLPTSGNKATLVLRLNEVPVGERGSCPVLETGGTIGDSEECGGIGDLNNGASYESELLAREMAVIKKEKELLRMENEILKRERHQTPRIEPLQNQNNISIVSELKNVLPVYDGTGNIELWIRQIEDLKKSFALNDDIVKLILMNNIRGKALTWLHSKTDFISIDFHRLCNEMRMVFTLPSSKLVKRREFEGRKWLPGESFVQYFNDKIAMSDGLRLEEAEMIEYIIEGISNYQLRTQATLHCFARKDDLLRAFARIELPKPSKSSVFRSTVQRSSNNNMVICYNCSGRGHFSRACPVPKRPSGSCFRFGSSAHKVTECPGPAPAGKQVALIVMNEITEEEELETLAKEEIDNDETDNNEVDDDEDYGTFDSIEQVVVENDAEELLWLQQRARVRAVAAGKLLTGNNKEIENVDDELAEGVSTITLDKETTTSKEIQTKEHINEETTTKDVKENLNEIEETKITPISFADTNNDISDAELNKLLQNIDIDDNDDENIDNGIDVNDTIKEEDEEEEEEEEDVNKDINEKDDNEIDNHLLNGDSLSQASTVDAMEAITNANYIEPTYTSSETSLDGKDEAIGGNINNEQQQQIRPTRPTSFNLTTIKPNIYANAGQTPSGNILPTTELNENLTTTTNNTNTEDVLSHKQTNWYNKCRWILAMFDTALERYHHELVKVRKKMFQSDGYVEVPNKILLLSVILIEVDQLSGWPSCSIVFIFTLCILYI